MALFYVRCLHLATPARTRSFPGAAMLKSILYAERTLGGRLLSTRRTPSKLGLVELIAIGIGGMVGGGIFSVLGLSVELAGHAAILAFAIGGVIALLTGICYGKLGLAFQSDGGSFTYLEHAFRHKNVAGVGGWLLLVGYIGTMALYAYTFGAYGSALLGDLVDGALARHGLASAVLLLFLAVNLIGVKTAGRSELILVTVKVAILALFAAVGLFQVQASYLTPLVNRPLPEVLMGAALIFVAYEGFELIPNAIHEMKDPRRNLLRALLISILLTTAIYVIIAFVSVGTLTPDELIQAKEYALAMAARPALGHFGFVLIALAALLSTASAINATLFGTARLAMVMAGDEDLPKVFSFRERTRDVPWVSLAALTGVTLFFVNTADLVEISSFASSTFLLIFAAIHLSALRVHRKIGLSPAIPAVGLLLVTISWAALVLHMGQSNWPGLARLGGFYLGILAAELLYSKRSIVSRYLT